MHVWVLELAIMYRSCAGWSSPRWAVDPQINHPQRACAGLGTLFPHSIISTSSRCEPRRCELVDLLFSLVWVLGDCLISILGHGLNCLVMWTAGLKSFYFRAWKRNWLETAALWCRQTIQLSNVLLLQCRYVSISRFQGKQWAHPYMLVA